ncbi:MAG: sialate O-acetylesterase [Parafilimonas sp.]
MKKICLLIFTVSFFFLYSSAQIKLPDIISDSMMLQQSSDAPIWGWASAGEKIEVSGSWSKNPSVQTTADKDGKWMVKIKTPVAGGPYDLSIKGNQTTILHGILIGEVWICSGQSNMEMPVEGWGETTPINNSAQEIANANYPSIRLFIAEKKVAFTPQDNVKGKWVSCNPASVAQFSATGYFFGRELYNHLHVPVGLMDVTWGGTIAEAWTSEASLRTMSDFNDGLNAIDAMKKNTQQLIITDKQNEAAWNKAVAESNNGYATANLDTSWHTMQLPTLWENAGYKDLDGIVWFKKEIDVPASWAGKQLQLDLGPIDDMDVTYFNGKAIDSTVKDNSWAADRHYTIPSDMVQAGKNIIAVKVTDNGGGGGIYGKKEQLKLYPVADNINNGIDLSGDWVFKIAAIKPKPAFSNDPNQPSVLYNGMIAPIVPFAIKGAIWYQGEANVGRAKQYETLLPLLISDWRKQWDEGNFPFYFVQIAPYNYGGDSTDAAALRDAQRITINASENTGMAVTMDIGNATNIHPADKQDVGKRLSYWALNKSYNQKNIVYSGPLYKNMEVKNNKIIVSFDYTNGGLNSNSKALKDFEVCGADNIWKPASASIDGDKVVVESAAVSNPVAVRYAWYSYAVASLFNGEGLPASSFSSAPLK